MSIALALKLAVFVPLLGALLIVLTGSRPNLREAVTLVTAITLFALVLRVALGLNSEPLVEVTLIEMLPGLSISLHNEGLSILFASIASGLWIVTSIYSIGYMRGNKEKHQTRFYACFAIALSGAMGVAFASNLLTLFVFYEVLTLSTYPLVAHKEDENARRGARTYLGILLATSIGLLLPAIIWTWSVAGTLDFVPGGILAGNISEPLAAILLVLFVLGVGKAAVMPVHRWLPAAMVAPTPVSALLHAVAVVKAGVFTITKIVIYTFGTDFMAGITADHFLVYLVGFTIVAASTVALRQTNLKRMLAYSTVSQLSYIVLAALVLTPARDIGAALHITAHAFGKITLFFAAGAIYVAAKKTEIPQLSGIGRRMPWTMAAFTIGALSMIGVPPTAGFVSKWFMISGAFEQDNVFVLVVLIIATGLNAGYFLPIIFRAFFDTERQPVSKDHGEAPWPMVIALLTTAALTLLFFFFNAPIVALEYGLLRGSG
jgi:multicomponent Na+:H+ antiporter subunit D